MTRASPDPAKRPIWPGTLGPSSSTPARAVPSWRRTTCIDIVFDAPQHVVLRGTGRDLATEPDAVELLADVTTTVAVELATRLVAAVDVTPARDVDALVGINAGGRFRKVLAQTLPDDVLRGGPTSQLLDDTPVTTLIASASLARRLLTPIAGSTGKGPLEDTCIGWRAGGEMMRAIVENDQLYLGEGPYAPAVEDPSDPWCWQAITTLAPGSMRRRRRIDIAPTDEGLRFDVWFRDTYIEPDGAETAVHEYEIDGTTDHAGVITAISARPRVLPGPECPGAAASALRLVGVALPEIRSNVSSTFTGITTCTHLNDTLRALGSAGTAYLRLPS